MKFKDAEWLFFDIGHTLVDENAVHAARAELCIAEADALGLPHNTVADFFTYVYEAGTVGTRAPVPAAMRRLGAVHLPQYDSEGEVPYPGAAAVLGALHTRYKIGVITNQPGGTVRRLRAYGLLDDVDFVYSSSETGLSKPSPEFYASALRALGVPGERCVMVGDRPDNDVRPARANGMMTIRLRQGFQCGYNPAEPELCADLDVPSLTDLPRIFDLQEEYEKRI